MFTTLESAVLTFIFTLSAAVIVLDLFVWRTL